MFKQCTILVDAGEVPCTNGTVQLTGGPNEYEGRVEFCANGGWVQVCGGGAWGQIPASLVCLSLQNSTTIRCELIFYACIMINSESVVFFSI
jgi:hypothetical protein